MLRKYIEKFLFPDFSNRLTLLVIALAAAISVTPDPIKIIIYNWIISMIGINDSASLPLPTQVSDNTNYWVGLLLAISALIHNLIYKTITLRNAANTQNIKAANIFYSGSDSMKLIKQLESNEPFEDIENSVFQMLWQMERSGYSDEISQIDVLRHVHSKLKESNSRSHLSLEERSQLKSSVLRIKDNYASKMKTLQPDYEPCSPERKNQWLESKAREANKPIQLTADAAAD